MAAIFLTFAFLFCAWHYRVDAAYPYYGRAISSDWGDNSSVIGAVYAMDNNTIQIINFTFIRDDCSRFYLVRGNASTNGNDSITYMELAGPNRFLGPLHSYQSENVIINFPSGAYMISDFAAIAIRCPANRVEQGRVQIPDGFVSPAPQSIGQFSSRAHSVRSGEVTVLNDRQIQIKAFRYDGQGPDAFFYVGITNRVEHQQPPYGVIPDENGISDRKAGAYSDKDIVLTLPDSISVTDLKWLSMYCIAYHHNFGEVFFPDDLNVPPYQQQTEEQYENEMNCEPLSDDLQVSWRISQDEIIFELAGKIDRETDYMAFGLSGSSGTYSMYNADVTVVDWRENSAPRATDYFLNSYSQCVRIFGMNFGVCPDRQQDVRVISSRITDGIIRVTYSRKLYTEDSDADNNYMTDGTPQQIVWAIGPLTSSSTAAKHYSNKRISEAKALDFGRKVADNCPSFTTTQATEKPDFLPHHIYGNGSKISFTVELGQSGMEQGYTALTGLPSWGIAWYIDSVLIPELHLQRNVTYTFHVAGGLPFFTSNYHPFYLTDSLVGGYSQNPNDEVIYPLKNHNGYEVNYAVGSRCIWQFTNQAVAEIANGKVYQNYEAMHQDLERVCKFGTPLYQTYTWTPDDSTPDTLYYQCYTHQNLGWKIHVYDQL